MCRSLQFRILKKLLYHFRFASISLSCNFSTLVGSLCKRYSTTPPTTVYELSSTYKFFYCHTWLSLLNFMLYFTPFSRFFSFFAHATLHYRSLFVFSLSSGLEIYNQGMSLIYFIQILNTKVRYTGLTPCFVLLRIKFYTLLLKICSWLLCFRSPLLPESLLFSFPLLIRCFSSQRFQYLTKN